MLSIEMVGFLGFVAAATFAAAFAHQRRMDVLHGPYIENRCASKPLRHALALVMDRFRWKARSMINLTSIIAC